MASLTTAAGISAHTPRRHVWPRAGSPAAASGKAAEALSTQELEAWSRQLNVDSFDEEQGDEEDGDDPRTWSAGRLSAWLLKQRLPEEIAHLFEENAVNGHLGALLGEADLETIGIAQPLRRRRLLLELGQLFGGNARSRTGRPVADPSRTSASATASRRVPPPRQGRPLGGCLVTPQPSPQVESTVLARSSHLIRAAQRARRDRPRSAEVCGRRFGGPVLSSELHTAVGASPASAREPLLPGGARLAPAGEPTVSAVPLRHPLRVMPPAGRQVPGPSPLQRQRHGKPPASTLQPSAASCAAADLDAREHPSERLVSDLRACEGERAKADAERLQVGAELGRARQFCESLASACGEQLAQTRNGCEAQRAKQETWAQGAYEDSKARANASCAGLCDTSLERDKLQYKLNVMQQQFEHEILDKHNQVAHASRQCETLRSQIRDEELHQRASHRELDMLRSHLTDAALRLQ